MDYTNMDDEFEIGRGEVIGPDMTVNVVLRWYQASLEMLMDTGGRPIKFVSVADISDEFHVAVYIPSILFFSIPPEQYATTLESMVSVAGYTFHEDGPDAVSRL